MLTLHPLDLPVKSYYQISFLVDFRIVIIVKCDWQLLHSCDVLFFEPHKWSNSHMALDSGIPEFRHVDLDIQLLMYFLENGKLRG